MVAVAAVAVAVEVSAGLGAMVAVEVADMAVVKEVVMEVAAMVVVVIVGMVEVAAEAEIVVTRGAVTLMEAGGIRFLTCFVFGSEFFALVGIAFSSGFLLWLGAILVFGFCCINQNIYTFQLNDVN